MYRNFIITAIRNLLRNKLNSVIISTGLVTSFTFCLLMILFVADALFWDRQHPNADQLHVLGYNFYTQDDVDEDFHIFDFSEKGVETNGSISYVHANSFRSKIPELQQSVLAYNLGLDGKRSVRINQTVFNEPVSSAEPGMIALIAHEVVSGNVEETEKDPLSVVVSERLANKHFPDGALNQSIFLLYEEQSVEVKIGAVVSLPRKSSIQFDILTNLETNQNIRAHLYDSQSNAVFHFLTSLPPATDAANLSQKIQANFETNFKEFHESRRDFTDLRADSPIIKFRLIPVKDIHLEPLLYWDDKADLQQVLIVAIFSLVLIILSVINYLLITFGNLSSRVSEIGMRRVNGASKRQVLIQFWIENSLINLLCLLMAVCLLQVLLPYLHVVTGIDLTFHLGDLLLSAGILGAILLLLCMFVGLYPSQVITRFSLSESVKGRGTYRVSTKLINALVTVQFLLCFSFIGGSLMVNNQMQFMIDRDLGIDQDQVLYLQSGDLKLKQALLQEPEFEAVGRGGGWLFGHARMGFIDNIKGEMVDLMQLDAEAELLDLFGMQIDWLEQDFGNAKVALVNEATADLLGADSLQSYEIGFGQRIVGVVKNAHLAPYTSNDAYFFISPNSQGRSLWQTFVKVRGGQMEAGLEKLETVWQTLYPDRFFEFEFLDRYIASHYASHKTMSRLLNLITILGVALSCLGLLALSSIIVQNRMKEVGIRKVLGASVRQILVLLNQQLISLLLIAGLLSVPVSYFIVDHWLQNFSSHIGLNWSYFSWALAIGIGIASVVMLSQTIRSARLNPVKLIKDE